MLKTILVVEDVKSMLGLISITLENAGYRVIGAQNAREAMEKLGQEKVHMIISDVFMPGLSGIDLVRKIKQNPLFKYIPVVMLTTGSSPEIKEQGRQAGAKAWIMKPFKPETVVNVVKKIIG